MKMRHSGWAAIVALSLMAAPVSAGDPNLGGVCLFLRAAVSAFERGNITENPLKPKDVEVTDLGLGGSGFYVSWSIPALRPPSTVTGYFVHLTHMDSGGTQEIERSDSNTVWTFSSGCIGKHCGGAFDVKVKLKNNCEGVTDAYSDSVAYEPPSETPADSRH